jgi:hypothetical protein
VLARAAFPKMALSRLLSFLIRRTS